jgi:hypothetical protein
MTPDLSRWPHLKIPTHPVLDWVETMYTTERLTEIADAVGARGAPAIPVKGRRDAVWNNATENVLRTMVRTNTRHGPRRNRAPPMC